MTARVNIVRAVQHPGVVKIRLWPRVGGIIISAALVRLEIGFGGNALWLQPVVGKTICSFVFEGSRDECSIQLGGRQTHRIKS